MGQDRHTSTDSALESKLDDLEEQVLEALFGLSKNALSFQKMIKRVTGVESMRLANNDSQIRLSNRDILIELEVTQGCKSLEDAFPIIKEIGMCFNTEGQFVARTVDQACP